MRSALRSEESYWCEDTIKEMVINSLWVSAHICGYKFPNNFPRSISGGPLFICSCSYLLSSHSSGVADHAGK